MSLPCQDADVVVIGGGIAGAGAAFELSKTCSVVLLERESQCGYHATGRSAASFTENYGTDLIRRLAVGSRSFLAAPPDGFCEHRLLTPSGMITIGRSDQADLMRAELDRARRYVPSMAAITPDDAVARVPILRRDYVACAIIEPHAMDIDVHGLHQGFLRGARARGASVLVDTDVTAITREGGRWRVETPLRAVRAPVVVNASGAWADGVAAMAGVPPLGLEPRRRTAFNVPAPVGTIVAGWPLVNDVGEEFYVKATAGQLMVSPADAVPSAPMDAWADDMDVAVGVERLERATTLIVDRVSHSWAGLRTFASDGSPVVGQDETAEGFVWLAGQGGYGIKTSPALSRIVASLVRGEPMPEDLSRLGITAAELTPARLRRCDPQRLKPISENAA